MLALVGPCFALATPAAKLIQCATLPSSPGCSFPPAPNVFDARFSFGSSGKTTIHISSSWCPLYANLFWKLILLGFYSETPAFRVDYRNPCNAAHAFMAQMGWNLQEGVQDSWDTHRAIAQAVPATESNTRGRVAICRCRRLHATPRQLSTRARSSFLGRNECFVLSSAKEYRYIQGHTRCQIEYRVPSLWSQPWSLVPFGPGQGPGPSVLSPGRSWPRAQPLGSRFLRSWQRAPATVHIQSLFERW